MGSETTWSALGLSMLVVSAVLVVIGFSTPYWMVTEEGRIISTQLEK